MATLGHIGKFDPADESISAYLERVELFFAANGIEEPKQVAVFLSVIGPKNYALLRDLLAPVKPQEKSLAALFETLQKHFEPKPVIIAERFRFAPTRPGQWRVYYQILSRTLTTGNTLPIQRISR